MFFFSLIDIFSNLLIFQWNDFFLDPFSTIWFCSFLVSCRLITHILFFSFLTTWHLSRQKLIYLCLFFSCTYLSIRFYLYFSFLVWSVILSSLLLSFFRIWDLRLLSYWFLLEITSFFTIHQCKNWISWSESEYLDSFFYGKVFRSFPNHDVWD